MGSVSEQTFSDLSTYVQSGSLPLKDIHRLVLEPLLCYLGSVFMVVVLLEDELFA